MAKYSSSIQNGLITLNAQSETPLYRQLYDSLRKAILAGLLAPGTRLQSSREIAKELSVSRNTVVNAFEQLLAEGYLEGQVGSGTYVSRALPEELHSVKAVTRSCARTRGKVFAAFAPSVPRARTSARVSVRRARSGLFPLRGVVKTRGEALAQALEQSARLRRAAGLRAAAPGHRLLPRSFARCSLHTRTGNHR